MNVRNLFLMMLVAGIAGACGDSTVDDQPADPESGLETLDAKDDSFAVRPGSPEAQAVVDYLNQPLADDVAGEDFRVELDAVLYRRAANNIADYRAGADASFGTPDDLQFENITEVDAIPFVGRSSLMRLFEVAEAEGYFQRASVNCADYLPHDRWNNYSVDSYADLLEVENSKCTTIDGNLNIHIRGTDLLPPSARAVDHLRHLVTVNGNVQITTTDVFESMHFDSLETITGTLTARGEGVHLLEFDSLTGAESIDLRNIEEVEFPALEYNADIRLNESDYTGFTALSSADSIRIDQRTEGAFAVDFPALVEARRLNIYVERINRYHVPNVTFEGGFSALEKVDNLEIREGNYGAFTWPSLESVGSLRTERTIDLFAGMDALRSVDRLNSNDDSNDAGVHIGPAGLETAGSIAVVTEQPVDGYPSLTTVEQSITVTSDFGVTGFEAVETIGSRVTLNLGLGRDTAELNGFNAATIVGGIVVNGNNIQVTVGDFFTSLEFTESSVSLQRNARFSTNPVFSSLLGIGGDLRVDSLKADRDMMPVLEIVDGAVTIEYAPEVFTGFDKVEHIEGTLSLRRRIEAIDGFASLKSLGGNLVVSRSLDATELDDFLNQLEEFSGSITYD